MKFTDDETETLRWLYGGGEGEARPIPQRLVLRGYVDFDHALRPKPFLTRRGASSAYYFRQKSGKTSDAL